MSTPVADKTLAERLARLDKVADRDRDIGNALTEARRSGQLITLAEAQVMMAAAILDAQIRAFERGRIDTPDEIRAAATCTKKGPPLRAFTALGQ